MKGTPSSITKSPDEAFLSTKRGQCGIIYASAPDLKRISDALNRDGHAFRYLSIWISPEAVEASENERSGGIA